MRVTVIGGTGFIGHHVHDKRAAVPVVDIPHELTASATDVVVLMVPVGERDAEAAVRAFRGVARRIVAVSSGDVYRAYGRLIGRERDGADCGALLSEDAPLRRVLYP